MKKIIVFVLLILFTSKLYSSEIPTIVIAPSKKLQSLSTVGTSVVVLDEKFLEDTEEFLGDVSQVAQQVQIFSKRSGAWCNFSNSVIVYLKDTQLFISME